MDAPIVRRVRVRETVNDPLQTPSRLAQIFESTSWNPDLAPDAILCIRHLHDPLPGTLDLNRTVAPLSWQRALSDTLAHIARRAAHPAREFVPANAEAVVFANRAELLACLASDWCEGVAPMHWWWHGLFQDTDIASRVARAWLDAIEYVPAALQQLAERGSIVEFVRRLEERTTRAMLDRLVKHFALVALSPVLADLLDAASPRTNEFASAPPSPSAQTQTDESLSRPARDLRFDARAMPVQSWVPEINAAELTLTQTFLLGVGLMLQRAPNAARSSEFAHAVLKWQQAETKRARDDGRDEKDVSAPHAEKSDGPVADSRTDEEPRADATSMVESSRSETDVELAPSPDSTRAKEFEPERIPLAETHTRASKGDSDIILAPTIFETQFGGAFYLINLALYLELYADFTMPLATGLTLAPWDFVALVARDFCGADFVADPIWHWLAQLAGRRDDEEPGREFIPPDEWRVPPNWLEPFADETLWKYFSSEQRLRVQHPAGFAVLDVPRTHQTLTAQLAQEMKIYPSSIELHPSSTLDSASAASQPRALLARWLDWLAPYLRARLARALALTRDDDLTRVLFKHSARVAVTLARLDVHFLLADLPLAIRFAGLDRDPGWVPAAGRRFAFHFE